MKNIWYLSLPSDFKTETIQSFADLNKNDYLIKVWEVYWSFPNKKFSSSRFKENLPEMLKENDLIEYINECKHNWINFNYVMNQMSFNNFEFSKIWKSEIIKFVQFLYDIWIRHITIANPKVMYIISSKFKNIHITISIVNNISSLFWIKSFMTFCKWNISKVYLWEDMNRDIVWLKDVISKSDIPVALILNNNCVLNCPNRTHHYNFLWNPSENIENDRYYYSNYSNSTKIHDLAEVVRTPFIRPKDIYRFLDLWVKYFKIAWRETIQYWANLVKVAEIYMKWEYDDDLFDLFMNFSSIDTGNLFAIKSSNLDSFMNFIFSKKYPCSRNNCIWCNMCDKYWKYVSYNKEVTPEDLKNYLFEH